MKQRSFGRFDSHHPCIWRCVVVCCAFVLMSFFGGPSSAEIVTDGTVGPVQNLAGPDFQIGAELGTIRGANLFHSFQTFNIYTGESATYTGPASIENVISRITGGEISTINGLLRSEVGHADFYFINPSGVIFGPNAQVDVPGAFHVSTATELRFEDDTVYSATDTGGSTLSLAQPESFGFLSPQPASITVNGSRLEFAPGSHESLSAGDVTIQGGASLVSAAGDIRITAIGDSGGVVPLAAEPGDSAASGTVTVTGASTIDVSGTEGRESVTLRGGQVEVANSVVAADHSGNEDSGGQILLEADSVRVINSDIRAKVFGAGRGNDILVIADSLEVDAATATDGRSCLKTRVMSGASGAAGDVRVEATEVTLTNGGQLSSIIEDGGMGQGGTVKVEATDSIIIEGSNEVGFFSGIYSTSLSEVGAEGGDILIDAPDAHVTITDGGVLQAGTAGPGNSGSIAIEVDEFHILDEGAVWAFTLGSGVGGNVTIAANHSILLDNADIDSISYDTGAAGHIQLTSDKLSLLNGSEILADTYGSGAAGNIGIEVSGSILLDNFSYIEAATGDTGPAGQVVIEAGNLSLLGASAIYSGTQGSGDTGSLNIDVGGSFLINDNSFISCGIWDDGSGTTGGISITASTLEILNGGSIDNATLGDGDALPTVIEVTDLVIDGGGTDTGICSDTYLGSGKGGDIRITAAGQVALFNGGQISSNTYDAGNAGTVSVEADEMVINGGGEDQSAFTGIYTDACYASGAGGNVEVTVNDRLEILHGGQISSSTMGGQSDAGTVNVQAAELVIDGEDQLLSTGILGKASGAWDGSSGDAGDVSVTVTDHLEIRNGGEISSSVELGEGNAGTVAVTAADISIDGQDSGIFSSTTGSLSGILSGVSGEVQVTATQRMELRNAGQISTSSGFGGGDAGAVTVKAPELEINGNNSGIFSEASFGSLGEAGSVLIFAQDLEMVDQGQISVASAALLSDENMAEKQTPQITVTAPDIHLTQGAMISAESTGNVPAGAVEIQAGELLLEGESRITTESNEADGGPIRISGQNIVLRDSMITTSVLGLSGDGGNININADALVLQGGFIQGNTAAPAARGGDIFIDTDALVASYGLLEVGGTERLTFQPGSGRNVIQAAAPGGAHGTITITSPELDIGGALVPLSSRFADTSRLISDPCVAAAGQTNSSLIQRGRGGLPAGPEQPAAVFFGGERLDRLLDSDGGQSVNGSQAGEGTNSSTGSQRGQ